MTTLLDQGRRLLAAERARVVVQPVSGAHPRRGLWLVNTGRKRVAGQVFSVTRKGQLVVYGALGSKTELDPDLLTRSGYVLNATKPAHTGEWEWVPMFRGAAPTLGDFIPVEVEPPPVQTLADSPKPKPAIPPAPQVHGAGMCLCGCGGVPKARSRFLPGHDMKLKSFCLAARRAGQQPKLTPAQAEYVATAHWWRHG